MDLDLTDRRQFEAAYRSLAPHAKRVALKVLRDHAAAEDVVQDLFLQLWREPRAFDPGRGTLRAYVSMLARSRALDRWRSRAAGESAHGRFAREVESGSSASADGADVTVLGKERRRELISAVAKLPPEQRDALLAYGRGVTASEIASDGDLPVGTAKSRIRLGLARARDHLTEAA
jgi:RNA polymerase sigma-70 factor (ECF subfamily)